MTRGTRMNSRLPELAENNGFLKTVAANIQNGMSIGSLLDASA